MNIAQVAPLHESVPPKLYGGTERVVSYLTEELVRQGHNVTLFASGDSHTTARLIGCCRTAIRLNHRVTDPIACQIAQLKDVTDHARQFDVIHFHTDYFHFPTSELLSVPCLTTLHGRLDLPDLAPVYHRFSKQAVVSISNAQRLSLPYANWIGTVYHGLPRDLYKPGPGDGEYVAFLGRISPEKRPDRAIEIACRTGIKIKIAAKVDKADEQYFREKISHLLDLPGVEFIGEIGESEKAEFIGRAKALLFPIDWPEPFGMVMIESMACGTPVIAFNCGSVPEVIDSRVSGFIVNSVEESVSALKQVDTLSRERVRKTFEERFSVETMARRYVALYHQLVAGRSRSLLNNIETVSDPRWIAAS